MLSLQDKHYIHAFCLTHEVVLTFNRYIAVFYLTYKVVLDSNR